MLSVEVVSWRVRVGAPAAVSELRFGELDTRDSDALIEHRMAYFEERAGFVEVPVFARARLPTGGTPIVGPALIEEAESTAVVGPSASVVTDAFGNLVMTLRARSGA